MKILYGDLENYGIHVYIDENNNLFIADSQTVFQYDNTKENISRCIQEAQWFIRGWKSERK